MTELVAPEDQSLWERWWDGDAGAGGPVRRRSAIGLDPGMDVFLTGYLVNRQGAFSLSIGVSTIGRLQRLQRLYDDLQARLAGLEPSDESAAVRLRGEMATNLRRREATVEQLHHVAAAILVGLSDLIVLPVLNAKGQLSARGGGVGPAVRGGLLALAHGRFRVLLQRAADNAGAELALFHESFTSKFCGRCVPKIRPPAVAFPPISLLSVWSRGRRFGSNESSTGDSFCIRCAQMRFQPLQPGPQEGVPLFAVQDLGRERRGRGEEGAAALPHGEASSCRSRSSRRWWCSRWRSSAVFGARAHQPHHRHGEHPAGCSTSGLWRTARSSRAAFTSCF